VQLDEVDICFCLDFPRVIASVHAFCVCVRACVHQHPSIFNIGDADECKGNVFSALQDVAKHYALVCATAGDGGAHIESVPDHRFPPVLLQSSQRSVRVRTCSFVLSSCTCIYARGCKRSSCLDSIEIEISI